MPRVKKRHTTKNFAAKRKSQSPLPEETGIVSGLPDVNDLGEGDYASCYDDDSSDDDSVDNDGAYVGAQATLPMHWAQRASQRLEMMANNHGLSLSAPFSTQIDEFRTCLTCILSPQPPFPTSYFTGCPPFLDEEADSTEDEDSDADDAQLLVRQINGGSSEDEAGNAQAAMGGEENAVTPLSGGGSGDEAEGSGDEVGDAPAQRRVSTRERKFLGSMAELGVIRSHKRQRRGAKGMGETKAPKLNARQNKGMLNRKEYVKRTFAAKESHIALAKEARAKLGPALAKYLRRNDEKSLIPLAADPSNVTDKQAMLFLRAQVVDKYLELQIESNNEKRLANQRECAKFFNVSTYLVASWTRQFLRSEPRPLQEVPAAQGQAAAALSVTGGGTGSGGTGGGGMGGATSAAAAAATALRPPTAAAAAQGEDRGTLPAGEGGGASGAGPDAPLTGATPTAEATAPAAAAARRVNDGGTVPTAEGEGGRGGARGAGPGAPLTGATPTAVATAPAAAAARRVNDGDTVPTAEGEGGRGGARGAGPGAPLTGATPTAVATAPAAAAAAARRVNDGGAVPTAEREGGRGGRARGRFFVDTMPTYQGGGDVPPKEPTFSELNPGYPSELIPEADARHSSLRFVSIGML